MLYGIDVDPSTVIPVFNDAALRAERCRKHEVKTGFGSIAAGEDRHA